MPGAVPVPVKLNRPIGRPSILASVMATVLPATPLTVHERVPIENARSGDPLTRSKFIGNAGELRRTLIELLVRISRCSRIT